MRRIGESGVRHISFLFAQIFVRYDQMLVLQYRNWFHEWLTNDPKIDQTGKEGGNYSQRKWRLDLQKPARLPMPLESQLIASKRLKKHDLHSNN